VGVAKGNVRTYRTGTTKPVDDWLKSLGPVEVVEALRLLDLLEEHGIDLPFPHSSHLEDGIRELRGHTASVQIRLLYFHWKGITFGVVHGFAKKTKTTARHDIDLAKQRRDEWLNRARRRARKR
jgi:phage-related protein